MPNCLMRWEHMGATSTPSRHRDALCQRIDTRPVQRLRIELALSLSILAQLISNLSASAFTPVITQLLAVLTSPYNW
jgi:hypothetical protein